jgi:hypothetical protein
VFLIQKYPLPIPAKTVEQMYWPTFLPHAQSLLDFVSVKRLNIFSVSVPPEPGIFCESAN